MKRVSLCLLLLRIGLFAVGCEGTNGTGDTAPATPATTPDAPETGSETP